MTKNVVASQWITHNQASLVDDCQEIGYGEFYDVEYAAETDVCNRVSRVVTEKFSAFFKALKKIRKFSKVVIHDSEPVSAEFKTTTENGRRCLIKIRF